MAEEEQRAFDRFYFNLASWPKIILSLSFVKEIVQRSYRRGRYKRKWKLFRRIVQHGSVLRTNYQISDVLRNDGTAEAVCFHTRTRIFDVDMKTSRGLSASSLWILKNLAPTQRSLRKYNHSSLLTLFPIKIGRLSILIPSPRRLTWSMLEEFQSTTIAWNQVCSMLVWFTFSNFLIVNLYAEQLAQFQVKAWPVKHNRTGWQRVNTRWLTAIWVKLNKWYLGSPR